MFVPEFLFGLNFIIMRHHEDEKLSSPLTVLGMVNGELGVYTMGAPATEDAPAIAPRIQALTVHRGQVVAIYDIANPDKFTASPLR